MSIINQSLALGLGTIQQETEPVNAPKTSTLDNAGVLRRVDRPHVLFKSRESTVKDLIASIRKVIDERRDSLNVQDASVLNEVKNFLGFQGPYPMLIKPRDADDIVVDDILSIESLNKLGLDKAKEILGALARNLRASLFATEYKAQNQELSVGGIPREYQTFNPSFRAQSSYSSADLEAAINELREKKLFDFESIPGLGLMRTSSTINPDMRWQWMTDSCMVGSYQRDEKPQEWRSSMITNAAVYNSPEALTRIAAVVNDPGKFRTIDESKGALNKGLFHIFKPESVKKDGDDFRLEAIDAGTWANPKRLESQAMLLRDLLRTIKVHKGSKVNMKWGFNSGNEFGPNNRNREYVMNTIANLAQYILAANYNPGERTYDHQSPTISSWEEVTFWKGATWDTALVVTAFEELKDLLFNQDYNKDRLVNDLRTRLESALIDKPDYVNYFDPKIIDQFIQRGREIVRAKVITPILNGKDPVQVDERPADSSLVLLAASDYKFDENPLVDAKIRFGIVESMKKQLMGKHGMRRFNEFRRADLATGESLNAHDNYLSWDFQAALEIPPVLQVRRGQKPHLVETTRDSGTAGDLKKRQRFSHEDYAAQWTIGPTAAIQALASSKNSLLEYLRSGEGSKNKRAVLALLKNINIELTDFINNSLTHIVGGKQVRGEDLVRADGSYVPSNRYSMMEAFQVVTDLNGKPTWVPGDHTLAWSTAQLYSGLKAAAAAESKAEALGIAKYGLAA